MRALGKTMKEFVGGFDLPAYATNSIPDDVALPYLTYPLSSPEWDQKASWYIQGWYKTTNYSDMMTKCDQILKEIGTGIILSTQSGYVVIYPESPVVQFLNDEDQGIKSFYINLSINSYHMPGE